MIRPNQLRSLPIHSMHIFTWIFKKFSSQRRVILEVAIFLSKSKCLWNNDAIAEKIATTSGCSYNHAVALHVSQHFSSYWPLTDLFLPSSNSSLVVQDFRKRVKEVDCGFLYLTPPTEEEGLCAAFKNVAMNTSYRIFTRLRKFRHMHIKWSKRNSMQVIVMSLRIGLHTNKDCT